ncbi:MAG TPA: hypothetical protein VF791_14200 [Pyrinomonadaceae bacterium]
MHKLQHLITRTKAGRSGLFGRALACATLVVALLVTLSLNADAQSAAPSQLTIVISGQGMTPASATVSTGIVHLALELQGSQEQLTLRVSRENGELVREITIAEKATEWATELELGAAGQYVLSVAGHTSWSCRITAQAPPPPQGPQPGTNPLP